MSDQMTHSFKCIKCGSGEYKQGEARMAGSLLTKLFNIQNRKFTTLSCENCGFTEFYSKNTKKGENVLDFLAS